MDRAEDRPRVWIVDDSPLDVRRARTALEPDYELAELADGSAALERLAAEGAALAPAAVCELTLAKEMP